MLVGGRRGSIGCDGVGFEKKEKKKTGGKGEKDGEHRGKEGVV